MSAVGCRMRAFCVAGGEELLATMTPAFQTEMESFSRPLNSRYQVYEIGIMSAEKFLLGMDSSQDRNLSSSEVICNKNRNTLKLLVLVSASQLRARTRTMKSKGCRPRTSRKEKTVSLEGVMESRMKSFISLVGTAGQACFSAVKAGVSGLTKATEKQYASRNITASFQEFYPLVTVSFQEFYLI
ncbi:hypothetical protein NC653_032918 [Populus alba x Populus x berolinensis]|uniref:Uncharacterized protein n=1 Tax=Populus alba x Populus x berolinensis TaxID=444605 RepID=A0AAD6LSP7_9ROSI|nr:hypothetical protein NC653_032918 [Populus alba x Populus x berolinensis]